MKSFLPILIATSVLSACGGGDDRDGSTDRPTTTPAPIAAMPSAPTGPMTTPEWYRLDRDARTVHMTVTAGAVPDQNYWNFNGRIKGDLAITVPEGFTVTIELVNRDPNMAHSLGISRELSNFMVPPTPDPVFPGAITAEPQSMTSSTMPGETETIQFVAATAGNYSMVCYVAGHTAIGMWLYFNASATGEAGVQVR